jgi:aminoglycoside 2''-phosphotransferase
MDDVYLSIIKKDYPGIEDLLIFNEGWDHKVIVVNKETAYRFPKNNAYESQLKIEALFTDFFSQISPLFVPHMTIHNKSNVLFVTYPFIKGTSFTYNQIQQLTPEERILNGLKLGTFLKTLHSIPLNKAKELQVNFMNLPMFWKEKRKQTLRLFNDFISPQQLTWVDMIFLDFLKNIEMNPISMTVNHSDLKPPHIIIDNKEIQGIIDFSEVVVGDPAYDFQYLGRYGKDFYKGVLESYGEYDSTFDFRQKFYEKLSFLDRYEGAILSGNTININEARIEFEHWFSHRNV